MLISWKRNFQLINSWSTRFSVSALLKQSNTGGIILVTNVYGPSTDEHKQTFIDELRRMARLVQYLWILGGDFNLVRWLIDRSGDFSNFNLMSSFNDVIRDIQLIDIPLKNRLFTWSNKRPVPTHSKIDRIFLASEFSLNFKIISLHALEVLVSDHAPLLLSCKNEPQQKKEYKLEMFWLSNPQSNTIIKDVWSENRSMQGQGLQKFEENTKTMHEGLRSWHCQNFGEMEKQLSFCKKTILMFDQVEERRQLNGYEFRFRNKVRERAFMLASLIESRWHHRSRCKWLQAGDKNTRYFHAIASSRCRRNNISNLQLNGVNISDEEEIRNAFKQNLEGLLGVENKVLTFKPQCLYPTNPNLSTLEEPFTLIEIEVAIKQLAKNKASGPDGLPNEFLQTHWLTIKEEICDIIQEFYDHRVNLESTNKANIIMIQKKEAPQQISDYRPISVLNVIPKLLAKILANWLRSVLPQLISPSQTAFVKGRQISENFNTTREILQHLSKSGKLALFLKVDFTKAFDSVSWSFLREVTIARGFPLRWTCWIENLLKTSSSRIVMNGGTTDFFQHKKGLRQGDPLSPMLFDLAVDVLQAMITVANSLLMGCLSNKIDKAILAHQYADDTAFIVSADTSSVVTLKVILRLFTSVSGLEINFQKSTWIPINIQPQTIHRISAILGYRSSQFPITYLGLPLTLKKPHRALYLPLIEKIESKLEGWKSKFISRGGRLQLMNSVLSSVPIYFMSSFMLPQWVIDRLDKIRRDFLWGKSDNSRGISLINWEAVCIPKENGGMGAVDLKLRNWAILLRWWCRLYWQQNSLWSKSITMLRCISTDINGPKVWSTQGSFFWNDLHKIKHVFLWSTTWHIGNGMIISYWMDSWIVPTLAVTTWGLQNRSISLREATLQAFPETASIVLGEGHDQIIWRWCSNGIYSAKSIYHILITAGKLQWRHHSTWTIKMPSQ